MSLYAKLILSHLPSGPAWSKDKESLTLEIASYLGTFLEKIDLKAKDLLLSFNPETAQNLGRWERELAIVPTPSGDEASRRRLIKSKYTQVISYNLDYLRSELKAIFGKEPEIRELELRGCGEAQCGEPMEPEWNHFVIELRGVKVTKEAFYKLKSLAQAHILFIVIDGAKVTAISGKYS